MNNVELGRELEKEIQLTLQVEGVEFSVGGSSIFSTLSSFFVLLFRRAPPDDFLGFFLSFGCERIYQAPAPTATPATVTASTVFHV